MPLCWQSKLPTSTECRRQAVKYIANAQKLADWAGGLRCPAGTSAGFHAGKGHTEQQRAGGRARDYREKVEQGEEGRVMCPRWEQDGQLWHVSYPI